MEWIWLSGPSPVWAADLAGRLGVLSMILDAGLMVKFVLGLLVALSIACWTIIFMKYRLFKRATKESSRFLNVFWNSKSLGTVFRESKELRESHLAEIFRVAYLELGRLTKSSDRERSGSTDGDVQMLWMDNMERALRSAVSGEVQRMEKSLPLLATTGNTAPFIGLFGTVWGIMASFHGIGLKGSATLAVVAPGISEALVATAAGLGAAIPAVVAYNHYVNRVRGLETEMANFANDLLNIIKRDIIKRFARGDGRPDGVEEFDS